MSKFLPSELIINPSGSIYHLDLKPSDIADRTIVVGDQGRVDIVADFFDTVEFVNQKREFACKTGFYKGKHITVLSTGIGTDNIDIVINELDALVNIDFETREEKANKKSLDIVRIGTCGILQNDIPVNSFILSNYALGIDNVGLFYDLETDKETAVLLDEIKESVIFPKGVNPYLVKASEELNGRFFSENVKTGITVTSSGFYGPQGRKLRVNLAEPQMNDSIYKFDSDGIKFSNLEMECSALLALSNALGHKATTICLGLANRRKKEFSKNYPEKMKELIEYVLNRI